MNTANNHLNFDDIFFPTIILTQKTSMNDQHTLAIVGPSVRFLSGISYYTIQLSNALSEYVPVRAVLFRHMLPKKFFPGWKRVGDELATLSFRPGIEISEILDWYNPCSWVKGLRRLRNSDIIIFEWWTSSVAHMYFFIQLFLFRKVPIIIEYHEVVDPLEQSILPIRIYSRIMGRIIRRFARHSVVHSEADRDLIEKMYHIRREKISIIPLGLFDQYPILKKSAAREKLGIGEENIILFFGLLRPYKGVKYLIEAFNTLPDTIRSSSRLLIVGEAWEDQESISLAEASPYREKITIINRYIGDGDLHLYFSAADMLVLPYTRASQSAVAQIGMAYGLPIIVTRVGGLEEGLHSYTGAFFISPANSEELREQLVQCIEKKRSFSPPPNLRWSNIGKEWISVCSSVLPGRFHGIRANTREMK
jgi:glycosyltransferase involved in cell wall biosynthesis